MGWGSFSFVTGSLVARFGMKAAFVLHALGSFCTLLSIFGIDTDILHQTGKNQVGTRPSPTVSSGIFYLVEVCCKDVNGYCNCFQFTTLFTSCHCCFRIVVDGISQLSKQEKHQFLNCLLPAESNCGAGDLNIETAPASL